MWPVIKQNVLKPALARLGTVAALYLVWGGDWMCQTFNACGLVTQGGAQLVVNWAVAVAFVGMDLIVEAIMKKQRE